MRELILKEVNLAAHSHMAFIIGQGLEPSHLIPSQDSAFWRWKPPALRNWKIQQYRSEKT